MWFEELTGFEEKSPAYVRENISVEGDYLISHVNERKIKYGHLEIVSLEDLRKNIAQQSLPKGIMTLTETVGDVQYLHTLAANRNALFQAASQFNLLEMVSPNVTPEQGIDGYSFDKTQGPACAIACGAGTIFRNYFVPLGEQLGQTAEQQVDCLHLLGKSLSNDEKHLWTMKNGYALATQEGLEHIHQILLQSKHEERETLKGKLQVGIQWNTEVTIGDNPQEVSQIYCSALPVAYSSVAPKYWESFARLILEATYEATLLAAISNLLKNGSDQLYLTLVGGGAFGNQNTWIFDALEKALRKYADVPLQVKMVSYGSSNPELKQWMSQLNL